MSKLADLSVPDSKKKSIIMELLNGEANDLLSLAPLSLSMLPHTFSLSLSLFYSSNPTAHRVLGELK